MCAGYANLFKAMCENANIKCAVINGYAKAGAFYHGKKLTQPNNAWNAVKIYDKWELIDVTWGRGFALTNEGEVEFWNSRYFLDDPNDFILEHFPEDDVWQLFDNEIGLETFFSSEMEEKRIIRSYELDTEDYISTAIKVSYECKI